MQPSPLQIHTAQILATELEALQRKITNNSLIHPKFLPFIPSVVVAKNIENLWSADEKSALVLANTKTLDLYSKKAGATLPLFANLVVTSWDNPRLWSLHLTTPLRCVFWKSLPHLFPFTADTHRSLRPSPPSFLDIHRLDDNLNLIHSLADSCTAAQEPIAKIYSRTIKVFYSKKFNSNSDLDVSNFVNSFEKCFPFFLYAVGQGWMSGQSLREEMLHISKQCGSTMERPKRFSEYMQALDVFELKRSVDAPSLSKPRLAL